MNATTTAVATRDGQPAASTALAIRPGQEMFNDKQRAALAVLGIKNATSADLAVFMHYCQKTGLDPFSKQIYMLHRRENQGGQWVDKQTIQVGIDGFRVIRDRAARRDRVTVEYSETRWYDADGNAYPIWLRTEPPAGCSMTVLKDGRPFPAALAYAEYVQTKDGKPIGKWGSAPAHQLEKCAEAFALRRAFPHDLGGIYIDEEMPAGEAGLRPVRHHRVTAEEITGKGPQTSAPAAEPAPAAGAEPAPPRQPRQRRQPHVDRGEQGINFPTAQHIAMEFKRLGIDDRSERLTYTALMAGVPDGTDLKSTADLSEDTQERILADLKACADVGQLRALIDRGDAPGGGEN